MLKRNTELMCYFYYLIVLFVISTTNILPQDSTINSMQKRTGDSRDELEKKIEQNANYYASDLNTKLNLTQSQKKYIYDIMFDYYTRETGNMTTQRAALRESKKHVKIESFPPSDEWSYIEERDYNEDQLVDAGSAANKKIASILDHNQKIKWKEIKDNWWENVKGELFNSDKRINKSNEIKGKKTEYIDNRDYEDFDVYYPGYDYK